MDFLNEDCTHGLAKPARLTDPNRRATAAALSAAYPVLPDRPVFLTVEQLSERNPAFTPPALRNLIFKAEARHTSRGAIRGNGLAEAGAIIRLGRRVLLDEAKFLGWVAQAGSAQ